MNELTPFIERYYPGWSRFAKCICFRFGIRNEADDVLGDVVEVLCRKPAPVLDDLLQHELNGDPRIKNYICGMIRWQAYYALNKQKTIPIDSVISLCTEDDEPEHPLTDEMRDATARLRGDDFVTPCSTHKTGPIIGSVSQIIAHNCVCYRAVIRRGRERRIERQFKTRHAAFEFLMSMSS